MSRQEDRERLFSEVLDRILAGEHFEVGTDMDADLGSALEFAQRMVDARPDPRVEFRTGLKSRLIQKLTSEESRRAEKLGWFSRLIRQPAWQATAAVVSIGVICLVLWAAGVFTPAVVPDGVLRVEADTNKSTYASGEEIVIDVSMKNTAAQPFVVDSYPPILSLMDELTGQAVYTFAAGDRAVMLNGGQEAHFALSWDQRDARGSPVSPGDYYIELEDIEQSGQAMHLRLTAPVRFRIRAY